MVSFLKCYIEKLELKKIVFCCLKQYNKAKQKTILFRTTGEFFPVEVLEVQPSLILSNSRLKHVSVIQPNQKRQLKSKSPKQKPVKKAIPLKAVMKLTTKTSWVLRMMSLLVQRVARKEKDVKGLSFGGNVRKFITVNSFTLNTT
jgi:hypothetical protein